MKMSIWLDLRRFLVDNRYVQLLMLQKVVTQRAHARGTLRRTWG